jgi:hypothetical protein
MRRGTAKAKLYCKLFVDRDWFRNLCRDVEMFRGDGNGHLVWIASSLGSNTSLLSAQGLCVVAQAGAGLCRMLLIANVVLVAAINQFTPHVHGPRRAAGNW